MSCTPENTIVGFNRELEATIQELEQKLEAVERHLQGCVNISTAKKAVIVSAKRHLDEAEQIHANVLAGLEEPRNDPDVITAKIINAATAAVNVP